MHLLFFLLFTACTAARPAAAQAVEIYLQTLVDKDDARLAALACPSYEADALLEFDAFALVSTSLENLACEQTSLADDGQHATVICQGSIQAAYGTDVRSFDLGQRTYSVVRSGGEWLVCGYTTPLPSPSPLSPTFTVSPEAIGPTPSQAAEPTPTAIIFPTKTPLPVHAGLDAAAWQTWPIIPIVSQNVRDIYQRGQILGNNPRAFSVFGDCQSVPNKFLGVYETDATQRATLPVELQLTIAYFAGSASRVSPTAKDGASAGALLWEGWHQNFYTCQSDETPIDCELRLNNPSFVFITVGTHYEALDKIYLRDIVEDLIEKGIVPILATKVDNREGDYSNNLLKAQLASEYNIPLWNFWAATQDLPEQGLVTQSDSPDMGAIYFNADAKVRFRLTALQALNAVWRVVTAE